MNIYESESFVFSFDISETFLPSSKIIDLEFKIRLNNSGDTPIKIYPNIAPFSNPIGWGGPFFGIDVRGAKNQELRTYYGPPSEPPNRNYYEKNMTLLHPGETHTCFFETCWIPNSILKEGVLSKKHLDPEGMDGMNEDLFRKSSFLIFNQNADRMTQEMNLREDFLRPNRLILFSGSGKYKFYLTYFQDQWVDFNPTYRLNLKSEERIFHVE
ncbi:hypothetical protein AB3N59_17360 [Leptospira sp. WS92.C1]